MNPRTPAKSVTLYDFKQRTIAYKDLTNRECFLGRLTHETLSEESIALQDVKNPVEVKPKIRSLDPRIPALTPTEIRNLAGQKTAAFCRKMNTWLLIPEKTHNINKRETDEEFEEHTLQYHGHRSSQYSHYERQTRRRFRNRGHRRRSHTKESVAEKENGRLADSEQSIILHYPNKSSFNKPYSNPEHFSNIADINRESPSTTYEISHFPSIQGNIENGNRNFDSYIPQNTVSSGRPVTSQDHFPYPNIDNRYPPSDEVPVYSRRHHSNSAHNDNISIQNNDKSKLNISGPFDKSSHFAKLRSDDISDQEEDFKSITTIRPEHLNQLRTDHPNVHSSLLHLLPLYKPLGQEFDFSQKSETGSQSTNQSPADKQRSIESEEHDPLIPFVPPTNKFIHFTDVNNNTSVDPDVSVNVLEIPKITKEFENIKNNNSYAARSQYDINERFPSSLNVYRPSAESHPDKTDIHNNIFNTRQGYIANDNRNKITFNRDRDHFSESEISATTELPVLTTRKYLHSERTTLDTSYVPSVHTAFRNLDDFNSFQIFPNYFEDNTIHTSTEVIPNGFSTDKATVDKIPQDLTFTTTKPPIKESESTNWNQRSDIPSENSNDKILPENFAETKEQHKSFPLDNRTGEDIFPHKIRYQNALRDFRPDEIIIDIENIPTNTPPPVTARFHQRILTTIQPTVRVIAAAPVRSDTAGRAEQISATSRRRLIPTSKFPRRRNGDKSEPPVVSGSIPFVHRGPPNHHRNKVPPSHLNQLTGIRHFPLPHQNNHNQFYHPRHPIPPSNIHMSPEMNQLHHVSSLNNLPPGVSVHPRHPQAPFADMIHSNRPPTMPILNDGQEHLKHHRQRHHRKKDRHHSCCRLRGNTGAFQSCCRNGGPCCSARSHRFVPPSNCCSSSKVSRQFVPANQIQHHSRPANKILPSVRTEKAHRSEIDNKDRCQKEKMCRTLYESTQQVMVCRNAHVEGC